MYEIEKILLLPLIKAYTKKITGIHNLRIKGGFIVAANHASYADHFFLISTVVCSQDRKIHFLAKKEHFDSWLGQIWHRRYGAVPIDRKSGGKDALNFAAAALGQGKIIGIYPEGTRSLDGKIAPGKTGVARLALRAQVPVVPVGLIGTFEILPKGRIFPRLKQATINIGKPLHFESLYGKENDSLIVHKVTEKIMEEIKKLATPQQNLQI